MEVSTAYFRKGRRNPQLIPPTVNRDLILLTVGGIHIKKEMCRIGKNSKRMESQAEPGRKFRRNLTRA